MRHNYKPEIRDLKEQVKGLQKQQAKEKDLDKWLILQNDINILNLKIKAREGLMSRAWTKHPAPATCKRANYCFQ